jgi:hypothetical protein
MKSVIGLLLGLITTTDVVASEVRSTYKKPALRFDVVVHNPNVQRSKHLLRVGILSETRDSFSCLGGATALLTLADYVVPFRPAAAETLVDADPPLQLAPQASARFSIALYPDDRDACGPWAASVRAVMVFDDGTRLLTRPERISHRELKALADRPVSAGDVSLALAARQPRVRETAIRSLPSGPPEEVEQVLTRAFTDNDLAVRLAAYDEGARREMRQLGPELTRLLKEARTYEDRAGLCAALGQLRYGPAARLIVATVELLEPGSLGRAVEALKAMDSSDAQSAVLLSIRQHADWGNPDATPQAALAYQGLIGVAFTHANPEVAATLSQLLRTTENSMLRSHLLFNLERVAPDSPEPFLVPFRAALQEMLRNSSLPGRAEVLRALRRVSPGTVNRQQPKER